MKHVCITLDLESDHAGHAFPETYDGLNKHRVLELLTFLKKRKIPLNVFIVGKLLRKHQKIVQLFEQYSCEFYLHSYSHDVLFPDSLEEIQMGSRIFHAYFGHTPIGYRAPEGRISKQGLINLSKEGFLFDASVFPSFWPKPSNMLYPRIPHRMFNNTFIEVPFTAISPLRLILSLSWIKLLGWETYALLLKRFKLPDIIVFNIHLHDLWLLPAYKTLPLPWRFLYRRNNENSFEYFERFIQLSTKRGYSFISMSQILQFLTSESKT